MTAERDALITGIGLVSCLGEGLEAHWSALNAPGGFAPVVDATRFAPFSVHPMAPLAFDRQIPKRGDQRQMEAWQRIGVHAAGLALDAAGVKGNAELLGRMDMIVAAGGGERDYAADEAILSDLRRSNDAAGDLNGRLQSDLRPTLFLAQLSNLLAGNISIVHGVVGSSRTFMSEEAAGTDAVRIASQRIAAGQGDIFLVGGSYNAERPDILLLFELGRQLWKKPFLPIWARQREGGGLIPGSVGCFLVIESRAHAAARAVAPLARIAAIATDRSRRKPGEATRNAELQLAAMLPHPSDGGTAVISCACGISAPTVEEAQFLAKLGLPVRGITTALGHPVEASFLAGLALAATAVRRGQLFAPLEPSEAAMDAPLNQALVTSWGLWRGEALALVTKA
jgi:3-oxoacyl-[acyl-carrier-protein] synthase II